MTNPDFVPSGTGAALLPRISVITPSFNHAKFLAAAMDSVLSQNYPGLEYIVMDGGSKDGSADIIRARADKLAYWQSERDGGQANALNIGLSRVTGDVIGWLNSDDLYAEGTLEKVGRYFAENPQIIMMYGDCLFINEDGSVRELIRPGPFDPAKLAYRSYLMQMAVFFRRELLERIGSFDMQFAYALDYDLWLRAGIALEKHIAYLPRTLACFRMHAQSQSVRDVLPAMFDALEVQRKLVALRPQPEWLKPISGDIFRAPLMQLLGAAVDEAALPVVVAGLEKILGKGALQPREWSELAHYLTAISCDRRTQDAGPALLSRVERLWIIACGGIETDGHENWLAGMLLELGWRHLHAGHVSRAFSLFRQACSHQSASLGRILRWRLVEELVRAFAGRNFILFLRGVKRKAVGLFQPGLPG